MARWLQVSRTNYLGTENHYSDGSVECYTPDGQPRACDPASVAAQQSFYQASVGRQLAPIPGVPTYELKVQDETALGGGLELNDVWRPPGGYYSVGPDGTLSQGPVTLSLPTPQPGGPMAPIYDPALGWYTPMPSDTALQLDWRKLAGQVWDGAKWVYGQINNGSGGGAPSACGAGFVASVNGGCVPAPQGFAADCPPGQVRGPLGYCITPSAILPGGKPFVTQGGGNAQLGRFGVALSPLQTTTTTLKCLPGMILGMDNLCYNRRDLRRSERKWKPGARPLLTGGEMNSLRKVDGIRKRLKKAAGTADLSCSKKGCSCRTSPSSRKKK